MSSVNQIRAESFDWNKRTHDLENERLLKITDKSRIMLPAGAALYAVSVIFAKIASMVAVTFNAIVISGCLIVTTACTGMYFFSKKYADAEVVARINREKLFVQVVQTQELNWKEVIALNEKNDDLFSRSELDFIVFGTNPISYSDFIKLHGHLALPQLTNARHDQLRRSFIEMLIMRKIGLKEIARIYASTIEQFKIEPNEIWERIRLHELGHDYPTIIKRNGDLFDFPVISEEDKAAIRHKYVLYTLTELTDLRQYRDMHQNALRIEADKELGRAVCKMRTRKKMIVAFLESFDFKNDVDLPNDWTLLQICKEQKIIPESWVNLVHKIHKKLKAAVEERNEYIKANFPKMKEEALLLWTQYQASINQETAKAANATHIEARGLEALEKEKSALQKKLSETQHKLTLSKAACTELSNKLAALIADFANQKDLIAAERGKLTALEAETSAREKRSRTLLERATFNSPIVMLATMNKMVEDEVMYGSKKLAISTNIARYQNIETDIKQTQASLASKQKEVDNLSTQLNLMTADRERIQILHLLIIDKKEQFQAAYKSRKEALKQRLQTLEENYNRSHTALIENFNSRKDIEAIHASFKKQLLKLK